MNLKVTEDVALDIVTDPKTPWKQITGKRGFLFERTKYLAESFHDGSRIRIVFEPTGRGILTAFQLNRQNNENEQASEETKNVKQLLDLVKNHLLPDEITVVDEFLQFNEPLVGFEALCDILKESRTHLDENEVQKIQALAKKMHLNPSWTWELLIMVDKKTGQTKFVVQGDSMNLNQEDKQALQSVLMEAKSQLSQQEIKDIEMLITVGEEMLATESFVYLITDHKIRISTDALIKIRQLVESYHISWPE